MGFISLMSTDVGSAEHSSRILEPVLHWLKPNASVEDFNLVHLLARKAAHLTEYAVLGLLVFRALRLSCPTLVRRSAWSVGVAALMVAAAFAGIDEFHQSFVPGRTPAVTDVLIDTCGAALGLGVIGLIGIAGFFRVDKAGVPRATPQL